MSVILPLASQDPGQIDALLDAAFGAERRGRTAYAIRQGAAWLPTLSFAAMQGDLLVGTLQSWPVALTDAHGTQQPLIMVGPVAVTPALQGSGHGRALMDAVVLAARSLRTEPLIMIGDPEYYGRFWGFDAAGTGLWQAPGPFERHRLLALSMDGRSIGGPGMLGPRIAATA